MRPRNAPYGSTPGTIRKLALPNLLPESTTPKHRTGTSLVFSYTATNHPLSRIPTPPNAFGQTETSHTRDPDGGTQALDNRGRTTRPHHCDLVCPKNLPELPNSTTGASKKHMVPGTKINTPLPTVPQPTNTQQQIETSGTVSPGNERRLRAGAGVGALLLTPGYRLHSETTRATYSTMTPELTATHHPVELDSGKCHSTGGARDGLRPPPNK